MPAERGGEQTPNQDKEIYRKLNGTQTEEPVKAIETAETPLPKSEVKRPEANIVIKEPAAPQSKPVKPVARPKPVVIAPITTSGDYVVQVASLRSSAEATKLWAKLASTMGDVVTTSYYADIKRADLGAKGIYYRFES